MGRCVIGELRPTLIFSNGDLMKAQFSLNDIDFIKRELACLLPDVKSSHRVEAMARGLGWNTNAALRAELALRQLERSVDDHAFTTYLKKHGFTDSVFDALAEAVVRCKLMVERDAIKAVMGREPRLTRFGFGIYDEPHKPREQRLREFEECRAALLSPHGIDEFLRAREFLSYFERRRTINQRASSYGLKHRAENFHRDRGTTDSYVSNGALIAAAVYLGFNIRQDGPNACFNIGAQQDHPVLSPGAPGAHLPPVRALAAEPTPRLVAWRNMMIAAINAGLEQHLFGLDAGDNRWAGENPIYRFTFGTMPAIACVGDAGFGELIFHVAARPTQNAEEWIRADNAGFLAGDAFAAGWLERRAGKWLQTSGGPICAFRRNMLPAVLQTEVRPSGYLAEGRLMM
jgi:predicted transcriptional regulator